MFKHLLVSSIFAGSMAFAVSSHDNYVYFDISGVKDFTFIPESYSVTDGQPFDFDGIKSGMKKESGINQAYIMIPAGRKNKPKAAKFFANGVGSGSTVVCDSSASLPKKLNFAVKGTMQITFQDGKTDVCKDVLVAQGHFGGQNNWWLGGANMSGAHISITGAATQKCSKGLAVEVFSPKTPCVNHFSIGKMKL